MDAADPGRPQLYSIVPGDLAAIAPS